INVTTVVARKNALEDRELDESEEEESQESDVTLEIASKYNDDQNEQPSNGDDDDAPYNPKNFSKVAIVTPTEGSTPALESVTAAKAKQPYDNLKKANIFNTPDWLCDLLHKFTGEIGLDPCTNAKSQINAQFKYGHAEDRSFINALTRPDWDKVNWVYLNPPGVAISEKEKVGKRLHLQKPFWDKCFLEMKKGNVERVVALVPQRSYEAWTKDLFSKALLCFVFKRISFEKEDGRKPSDFFLRTICYLDTDHAMPHAAKFVETFGSIRYISNVSMRIYKYPKPNWKLRYFSLCAGIGVADKAIQTIFSNTVCIGFSEIDTTALDIYFSHFLAFSSEMSKPSQETR
ncbi:hypothetical protein HKX48_003190, partial [Thoreauomyces humboldtii]